MKPFRRTKELWLEGFRYGLQKSRKQATEKLNDDSKRPVQGNSVLSERPIEWGFYINGKEPVFVGMSEDFHKRLQDNDANAWGKVTRFVDAELKRREEETS